MATRALLWWWRDEELPQIVAVFKMEGKHHPDSSNNVQMGIRHKQGMPMQSQFEQAILDVYDFCIKEKEAGVPIIPLNHFSKRVCELLKISDSSVKRVLRKRENGEPLAPLKRTRNRKSPVTDIDDYMRDAIARKVHAYNYQDKHFTMAALLEECKADLGFKGCEGSLRAILQKQLGFVFKKVDNKLKLEQKKVTKKRTTGGGTSGKNHMVGPSSAGATASHGSPAVETKTIVVQHVPQQQQQTKIVNAAGCKKGVKSKGKMQSVPVQTQTMPQNSVQDLMGHQDHMTATVMHTGHPSMVDIQMRHQGHQTDTIEHMALSGLVAHRANVIENMAMVNRASEQMALQQQQQQQQNQQQQHRAHQMEQMTTVISDYRKQ